MRLISFFVRRKKIAISLLVLVLASFFLFNIIDDENDDLESANEFLKEVNLIKVSEGSIADDYSLSTVGTVQSFHQVEIKAEASGRIKYLPVSRGEDVEEDWILLEVKHSILNAQVLQANARVAAANANLQKMKNGDRQENIAILEQQLLAAQQRYEEMKGGARSEEVDISKLQLSNSETGLKSAKESLENTELKAARDIEALIKQSQDLLEQTVVSVSRVYTQNLQNIIYPIDFPYAKTCELLIISLNEGEIEYVCFQALRDFYDLEELYDQSLSIDPEAEELIIVLEEAKDFLISIKDFVDDLLQVVEATFRIVNDPMEISSEQLSVLKSLVTSSQLELEATISKLTSQIEGFKSQLVHNKTVIDAAENVVTQARNNISSKSKELLIKESGSTDAQLAIQESQIKQLEIQIDIAKKGARWEDVLVQEAAVMQANADLAIAVANRDKAITRSPINGTIISLPLEFGDYVNVGELVAVIASRDKTEVVTFVTEKERNLIAIGNSVKIKNTESTGVIKEISPALIRDTKKIEVVIELQEFFDDLVLGQTVFVDFMINSDAERVLAPISAVRIVADQAFVYAVDEDNRVFSVEIQTAKVLGEGIELIDFEGDWIIEDISGVEIGEEVNPLGREKLPFEGPILLRAEG